MSELTIITGKNKDAILVEQLRNSGLPIVLYGVGLIADTAALYLSENGLQVTCRTLDDKYLNTAEAAQPALHPALQPALQPTLQPALQPALQPVAQSAPQQVPEETAVIPISRLQEELGTYNVLLCFFRGYREDISEFRALFPGAHVVDYLSSIYDRGVLESMDATYVTDHLKEFNRIYNLLEDKLSKDSMQAYLNAKINKDAVSFPLCQKASVFFRIGIVEDLTLHDNEVLVVRSLYRRYP